MKANINITPYIDILLVLLIIFMVIQPTMEYDLETRIPNQVDDPLFSAPGIVLTIDSDFRLAINGTHVAFDSLGNRLFEIYSARPDKQIFIQGSPELPFGTVAGLIDIAKGAGVREVGLMTSGTI